MLLNEDLNEVLIKHIRDLAENDVQTLVDTLVKCCPSDIYLDSYCYEHDSGSCNYDCIYCWTKAVKSLKLEKED